jgi:hypothetical protein
MKFILVSDHYKLRIDISDDRHHWGVLDLQLGSISRWYGVTGVGLKLNERNQIEEDDGL